MASGEPERILDERKVGNRVEYLVQRRGAAGAAWEPRIQLTSATSVLKEWQRVKEAKEAKDIRPEKRTSKASESRTACCSICISIDFVAYKKPSSPEKHSEQKQDLKRKHETPSSLTSPVKTAAKDDDMNFSFTTSIAAKPLSTPTKGESPAKFLPSTVCDALSC